LKKNILNLLKFLLFLGLGMGILYLVYWNQNNAYQDQCAQDGISATDCSLLDKVVQDFFQVDYFWVILVLAAFFVSNLSRAARWRMLLSPMGYKPTYHNSLLTILLGYFANLGLPRIGEVIRAGSMAQYEHIPVEKVMGTVVVDRIIDVICILLISATAFILEREKIFALANEYVDLESKFGNAGNLLLMLVGVVGLFLALFLLFRKRLEGLSLYQRMAKIVAGFADGLRSVFKLDNPALFLFHTLVIWSMYYSMTYLCFFAFEPTSHLGPLAGLLVFVFGSWGIVIPSPGGMGTYHFLAQKALLMYGILEYDGFSWANIAFFSINLGGNVVFGILALILLPILNRNYHPQPVLES